MIYCQHFYVPSRLSPHSVMVRFHPVTVLNSHLNFSSFRVILSFELHSRRIHHSYNPALINVKRADNLKHFGVDDRRPVKVKV